MKEMWNERYGETGFAFGTAPNTFLVSAAKQIPKGRVLLLGEGEGRNAVFLAEQGYEVVGVDAAEVGLRKAESLAEERGVAVTMVEADLADYVIEPNSWSGIVAIFCHLPPPLRERVHRACVAGLRSGGALVLESYTPDQLGRETGGPPKRELLVDLATLKQDFDGLNLAHAAELEREIQEGRYHNGLSAVVQVVGIKP